MAQDRGRVTPTSAISAITLSPEDTPNAEPRGLDPLATPPPPSPRQEARSIGSGTRASLESALESRSERLLALAMEGLGTPSLESPLLSPTADEEAYASSPSEASDDGGGAASPATLDEVAEEGAFCVGRDVEVSLSDGEGGDPSWDDVLAGVVVAQHGDGTFDVKFDSGEWETLPGCLVRLRRLAVGDSVAVYGRAGVVVGLGAVARARRAGAVDVIRVPLLAAADHLLPNESYCPDREAHWTVAASDVRRLVPRAAPGDDSDDDGGASSSWLDPLLFCGLFGAGERPPAASRRSSAPARFHPGDFS